MLEPADGSGVLGILATRLGFTEVGVSVHGSVEERLYRGLGLTIRRKRTVSPEAESDSTTTAERIAVDAGGASVDLDRPSESQVCPEVGLAALSATWEEAENWAVPGPALPESGRHPTLLGRTVGVVGFSAEESAAIGKALAAEYCSFLILSHADAEFRKGATKDCDLLVVSVLAEWVRMGSLHPAILLKTRKPALMVGDRDVLSALAPRGQGALRELVPAPWTSDDLIWRAATLLGRIRESRGRQSRNSTRKRVIIGDESPARAIVHGVLAQEGMECQVADNGVDVLSLAKSMQADAVIADVNLPGLDGFQILAEIRRDPVLKDAAVILVTARQTEADVLRGFGLGVDDYVTRPFSPMELAARLKRCLARNP